MPFSNYNYSQCKCVGYLKKMVKKPSFNAFYSRCSFLSTLMLVNTQHARFISDTPEHSTGKIKYPKVTETFTRGQK